MDDIDELFEVFRLLYASVEKLRAMSGPEMLLPGRVESYHSTLEEAYTAYGKIETVVDELGQQLEVEHTRLDRGVKKYGP
jgi:hypothetical protein